MYTEDINEQIVATFLGIRASTTKNLVLIAVSLQASGNLFPSSLKVIISL